MVTETPVSSFRQRHYQGVVDDLAEAGAQVNGVLDSLNADRDLEAIKVLETVRGNLLRARHMLERRYDVRPS